MQGLDWRPLATPAVEYLRGSRWFAGQGREIAGAAVVWASDPRPGVPGDGHPHGGPGSGARDGTERGPWMLHAVVEVTYAEGDRERYHVPLGLAPAGGPRPEGVIGEVEADGERLVAYDALLDDRLRLGLLDRIARASGEGGLRCRRYGDGIVRQPSTSRVLTAEQTNTAVIYDDRLFLKLFRRLDEGVNPELELTAALGEQKFPAIAVPLGSMETAEGTTLAVVQPFYRDSAEGWHLALERAAAWHAGTDEALFESEAEELGAVTAELHAALAASLPTTTAGPTELAAERARRTFEVEQAAGVVPALAPLRDAMLEVFAAATVAGEGTALQRVHGDYHLGQVIRTPHGWVVLDFEGEPRRSLTERRRPASRLRDVAGMLRSFDYAAFYQLVGAAGADAAAERAVAWAIRARTAFLQGYAAGERASHRPAQPGSSRDRTDANSLLRAFELEKALYEVMYEARYRPEWLPIPVGGVERLLR